MNKTPLVSVVMPVCNAEKYIIESINSIINQTFTDFELIIIDNASTDETLKLIIQIALVDDRIVVLKNKVNNGVVDSLNRGLMASRGNYYARADGDDIAFPTRLAEQVAFMNKNPNIIAVSAWGEKFGDATGRIITPISSSAISATMLFTSPIVHACAMIRKSELSKNAIMYRPNCPLEDFDLWLRLSKIGKLETIPKILFKYRVHKASMTARASSYIRGALRVIIRDSLHCYLGSRGLQWAITEYTVELHSRFSCHEKMSFIQYLSILPWLFFLAIVSFDLSYPMIFLRRLASYLSVGIRGKLLPQPDVIYKTHADIEKLAF